MTRVAFIDFEASGLHAEAHPTAVGLAIADTATGRVHTRSWIIAPHPAWQYADGREWDPGAVEITGLSPRRCREEGHRPDIVARALNAVLGRRGVVYANAVDDKVWLDQLYALETPVTSMPVTRHFAIRHVQILIDSLVPDDWSDDAAIDAWREVDAQVNDAGWIAHDPAHDAGRLADAYLRFRQRLGL